MLRRLLAVSVWMLCPLLAMALEPATTPTVMAVPTVAVPAALKIGVIDVRTTIQKSPQIAEINSQLTKVFKPREVKIVNFQTSLKADQDKLQKDGPQMTDIDRNALRDKIVTERANLQAMITSFQQDLDTAQNSAMQKLLSQIAMIVNDIAKQQYFDLVLQGDNVPYVVDHLNITNQVLQALSQQ